MFIFEATGGGGGRGDVDECFLNVYMYVCLMGVEEFL